MGQILFLFSLVLILVLFLLQSVRVRDRNQQIRELTETMLELEKQAGLGRLLTGIAHDLSTPLGALGCAWHTRRQALDKLHEILNSENDGDLDTAGIQKVLKALDNTRTVVDESLERSLDMVQHLRKAGRGEPEAPQVIAIGEVMDGVLRILDYQFKSGITVVNELDPGLQVRVRPGGLGRVFANLLVNSLQAMEDRGEIRISSLVEQGNVHVIITDTGPGLPDAGEGTLFCSGWTTKGCEEGSGLGLFISREIMKGFEGDIIAANSPSGGAQMTVCLPVADGENQ